MYRTTPPLIVSLYTIVWLNTARWQTLCADSCEEWLTTGYCNRERQCSIRSHVERTDFRRLARFRIPQQFYGERSSRTQRRHDAVPLRLSGTDAVELSNEIGENTSVLAKDTSSRLPMGRRAHSVQSHEKSYHHGYWYGTAVDIRQRTREEEVAAWNCRRRFRDWNNRGGLRWYRSPERLGHYRNLALRTTHGILRYAERLQIVQVVVWV